MTLFFMLSIVLVISFSFNVNNWATSWQNLLLSYANNKGADQPAHPRSLISTCVVRCLDSIIPLVSISEILSIYLASLTARAGLCLTWSQTTKRFSRDEAQLYVIIALIYCFVQLLIDGHQSWLNETNNTFSLIYMYNPNTAIIRVLFTGTSKDRLFQ